MARKYILFSALAVWVIVVSCQSPKNHANDKRQKPTTVFGLTPAVTEILFDICPANWMPNVCTGANYPSQVKHLPTIAVLPIDVEALAHAAPCLIVAEEGMHPQNVLQNLQELGFDVRTINLVSLPDIYASCDSIGKWMGREPEAIAVKSRIEKSIEPFAKKVQSRHLRVGVLLYNNPLMVYGASSWMHTKLTFLGLTNAFAEKPLAAASISAEELLATPMDILAMPKESEADIVEMLRRERPDISIVYFDEDLASRPSTRVADQLADICNAIVGQHL